MNDILDRTPKGEKLTANNGHEIYTKIHAKVRTGERDHLGEQRNGTARLRRGALQRASLQTRRGRKPKGSGDGAHYSTWRNNEISDVWAKRARKEGGRVKNGTRAQCTGLGGFTEIRA